MNMNKKLFTLLCIIISLFLVHNNVEAKEPCNTYSTEQQCSGVQNCEWNHVENKCDEVFVAEQPCSDDNIKTALRFFGYLLMIAKVAIPMIIIIMGTFDLFKSVIDKDEKSLGKQVKILLMRIVAGVFVFFIPTIVYALFGISSDLKIVEDEKYRDCIDCVLNPTVCIVGARTSGIADQNGNCPNGYTKGIDGICYNENVCGAFTTRSECPTVRCKWSARNGCQSK